MKMKNLNIGAQLKISFGIVLLFILILGATSWFQSNMQSRQINDLYEHPLKVRRAISELTKTILSMHIEYLTIMQTQDEKERQTSFTHIAIDQANAEESFDIIGNLYLGPKSDVTEARNACLQWISLLDEFRSLVISGKSLEELNRFDDRVDMKKVTDQVLAAIKKIDLFALSKGDQFISKANQIKKTLDIQLVILVSGLLILTILIVVVLIRNILFPIVQLTNVTKSFADGKLEERCSYASSNELGALSSSFNEMATVIQDEFVFKDRSAQLNAILLEGLESNALLLKVLEPLMDLTNSQVGAIYLLNDQKSHFEHLESIGLDSSFKKSFSALDYEGEFGIVLANKEISHIRKIPADTQFSLTTVNGWIRPREILTIPLMDNMEVIAIISLSNVNEYHNLDLRLVTHMQSTLTAWMNEVIASRKIMKMSENLKIQNQELEVQKRELASQTGELFEQNTELEMQKRQLAESNQMKSSFLSNMSHELRTPLNSVIALSGVLNRRLADKIPIEEYSFLNVIERNGKQLLSLINDILDLSRIEAGFEELRINSFHVNELILEVVDLIEPQAIQKNIHLVYTPNSGLPVVHSDFEKCRHILQNIVANAIKFTEIGEVVILAEADAKMVHIEVRDTGIGIGKEFLSRIFEEFRQADSGNTRRYGGTGLGLSFAKRYAEFLGGSISVESETGIGSKFFIHFPVHSTVKPSPELGEIGSYVADKEDISQHVSQYKREEKTILLVEDNEAILVQLKDMLALQGYQWMVARNGNEALALIANQIPDAMILDLMMPEIDGFEVLKTIREKEETSKIPVIILTAKYVSKEELAFLKHNHVHQLIQKGEINKVQFLNAVSRMMFPENGHGGQPLQTIRRNRTAAHPEAGATFLVIEDNPDNMLTIKALLQDFGEVVEALDGNKGIELALVHLPTLIFMDIALPGMNGTETLHALRKVPALENIPVIAVTASAMKGDKEQFLAEGFDEYIPKPIENEVFVQIIRKWTD